MSAASSGLFSPLKVGSKTLPNRICLTATLTNYGAGSQVTEPWKNFLIERARGGAGMVITEGIGVDPNAIANPAVIAGFDPGNAKGFKETADAVHDADSHIVAQLWHSGRQQLWQPTRSPQGVSDQPDAYSWSVPHVMNEAEIERVINGFVETGMRFCEAGFDGVELHGAHGYLITQFLSPWSNTRTDDWGGSLENRARFAVEIASRIRKQCGDDFIVGIKLPADEGIEGGIGLALADEITRHLKSQTRFDYFAYSQGNFSRSLENHVPDMHFRPGHFLDLHKALKGAAGDTPLMAIGRIGTGDDASRVIDEGYGDLVGMSRALIADPALPNKLKADAESSVRPCLYDNYSWGVIHMGKPIHEAQNPHVGQSNEASWTPSPAKKKKRVTGCRRRARRPRKRLGSRSKRTLRNAAWHRGRAGWQACA